MEFYDITELYDLNLKCLPHHSYLIHPYMCVLAAQTKAHAHGHIYSRLNFVWSHKKISINIHGPLMYLCMPLISIGDILFFCQFPF